jgi:hypothetical protein
MLTRSFRWTLVCALVIGLAAPVALMARNPIVMDMEDLLVQYPDNVKMLLENNQVWVFEVTLAPGEKLATHRTGDFFLYPLTDANLLYIPNYEPEIEHLRAGQVQWHGFEPHAVVNRGTTVAKYLVVARHGGVLPAVPEEHGCPLADVAPAGTAKVLLDNRDGRVTEVTLPAGAQQPGHCGLNRVLYSLNSYEVQMDGREGAFGAGMAHYHVAGNHAVKNVGETMAHYVVFELKR